MLRLALDAADSAAMAAFLALLMLRAASGIIAAPPPPPPSPNGGVIRFAAPDALGPSKFIPPRMLASRDGAALPDRTLAGAGVMNFRPSIKPSPFSVEIGPPRVQRLPRAVVQHVDRARGVVGRVEPSDLRREHAHGARLGRDGLLLDARPAAAEQPLDVGRRVELLRPRLARLFALSHDSLPVLAVYHLQLPEVKLRALVHRGG
eukprot:30109-Pelagococcus_subviridis.AAC.1